MNKYVLKSLIVWQLISVYLMATGVWPNWVAWINFGMLGAAMLFLPVIEGLKLFIVSIPFFVVLPNPYLPALAMWRPLILVLGFRWVMSSVIPSASWRTESTTKNLDAGPRSGMTRWRLVKSAFGPWDRVGLYLILWMLASLLWAKFPVQGLKQIIFILNAYFIYVIASSVIKTREQVWSVLKTTAVSLGIIVSLGYVQFIATFFVDMYYFWQYWALRVSSLYYGLSLAKVLQYSNSWFTTVEGERSLRMFSIMPDSHSFALICVFLIAFTLPFLWYWHTAEGNPLARGEPSAVPGRFRKLIRYELWSVIRFSGLAVVLSGTRGVWVGSLAPLLVSVILYAKNIGRPIMKKIMLSLLLILLLFPLSPLINLGLNRVRHLNFEENFLDRAASIFDVDEMSNVGRLIIWKDSLAYPMGHPLGTGYDNFIVSLFEQVPRDAVYAELGEVHNERYNLPQKYITAHSLYIQFLIELGLLGLALFACYWLSFLWQTAKFFWDNRETRDGLVLFVTNAALVILWILAHGVFDLTIFNDKVLLLVFLTLAMVRGVMKLDFNKPQIH